MHWRIHSSSLRRWGLVRSCGSQGGCLEEGYSCPWLLLSISWLPWVEQIVSTLPFHYDIFALKSASHGLNFLNPWAKINLCSFKLQVLGLRYFVLVTEKWQRHLAISTNWELWEGEKVEKLLGPLKHYRRETCLKTDKSKRREFMLFTHLLFTHCKPY